MAPQSNGLIVVFPKFMVENEGDLPLNLAVATCGGGAFS
jgi:hypothetical protein